MTLFRTFLDVSRDSDTKVDSQVYSLAGYFATPDGWTRFDEAWKAVLDEFGLPSFHMSEFEGWDRKKNKGIGIFEDWKYGDPRRRPLQTKLLKVIDDNTVGSVAFAVAQPMYERVVPERVKERLRSPYYFLFLNLCIGVQELMDDAVKMGVKGIPDDWTMDYLLARGDLGSDEVIEAWMGQGADNVRLDLRMEGVRIAAHNSEHPALQAADILCYEQRKQAGFQYGLHGKDERGSFFVMEGSKRPKKWESYANEVALVLNADTISRALFGGEKGELLLLNQEDD